MKILVTAGPTREAIDPVRFISNRSTGKMGYALARSGVERGHEVVLVSGPVALTVPTGVSAVPVSTAEEMLEAVREHLPWCEALIMAAAVADWRPSVCSPAKLKKTTMSPQLALERTPDILESIRHLKAGRTFVGFAAETDHVLDEAHRKVVEKGLDLILANDVSQPDAGFEVDTNRVSLVYADGRTDTWPLMSKSDVADRVLDVLERLRVGLS